MVRVAVAGVALGVTVALIAAAAATRTQEAQPFVRDALVTDAKMRLEYERRPWSAPGLGPAQAAILDGRHGFVATTGGAHEVPGTGFFGPTEQAEIDVTHDGGASWRVLWRGDDVVFDAIAAADLRHVYAWGSRLKAKEWCCAYPEGRAFLLASEDAGRSWRVSRAPLAPRRYYPGRLGVVLQALGGQSLAVQVGTRAARSDDGGRTWRRVPRPARANVIRFASRRVAYAGGTCVSRTRDEGRSWELLPATCGPPVRDIHVAGARVAVAQSWTFENEVDVPRRSVLRLSLDGGSNWRTVANVRGSYWYTTTEGWPAVTRVHFGDALHGWALSFERVQGTKFVMEESHVTADGGRTWRTTMVRPLPIAFAGNDHAWAASMGGGVLYRTADAGRTWRASVRPRYVYPSSPLHAGGKRLIVMSEAGTFETRDGAHTWRPIAAPDGPRLAKLRGELTYLRPPERDSNDTTAYLRSGTGWRRLTPPTHRAHVGAAGFTDSEHGVVADGDDWHPFTAMFATSDGGETWRPVRLPSRPRLYEDAVVAPGIAAIVSGPRLWVSLDEGLHWQRFRVPANTFDCGATARGDEAWLACSDVVGETPTVILRTENGGRSWTRRLTPFPFDLRIRLAGPGEAWSAGSVFGRKASTRSLWHTRDGGSTWRQVWVTVPPRAALPTR